MKRTISPWAKRESHTINWGHRDIVRYDLEWSQYENSKIELTVWDNGDLSLVFYTWEAPQDSDHVFLYEGQIIPIINKFLALADVATAPQRQEYTIHPDDHDGEPYTVDIVKGEDGHIGLIEGDGWEIDHFWIDPANVAEVAKALAEVRAVVATMRNLSEYLR